MPRALLGPQRRLRLQPSGTYVGDTSHRPVGVELRTVMEVRLLTDAACPDLSAGFRLETFAGRALLPSRYTAVGAVCGGDVPVDAPGKAFPEQKHCQKKQTQPQITQQLSVLSRGSAGGNERQAGTPSDVRVRFQTGKRSGRSRVTAERLLPGPEPVEELGASGYAAASLGKLRIEIAFCHLPGLVNSALPQSVSGCAAAKRMLSSSHLCCSLPAFIIYGLVFQVHELQSALFNVMGPTGPITVAVGEDAVLPCRFSPAQNAQDIEVTWFREQFSPFVHRYKGGQDQYGEQMLHYQGRTELLKDGLANSSVDLKIFRVQMSDRGNYTCFVRRHADYDEAVVELKVTASGSAPLIVLERYQDGGIRVACRSDGWYPQPQVLWQDPHGRHLPSHSENLTQDKSGLFAAESSIILARGLNQKLSCLVRHALRSQEQRSAFYISDPFFQNAHPWMIALGVVLVAVVSLLIVAVYLFKIKGKHEKKIAMQEAALRDCDAEIEKQAGELAWRRYAVPIEEVKVVLDPDTAHCDLVLSDDCKSVIREDTRQNIPDIPERFNPWRCVLGREGFTSGRYCWEVEAVDGGGWTVGVSREDVKRKGEIEFKPEEGIWAVGQWAGHFQALTSPNRTLLPEIQTPKRIRVSLDYEEGRVAFFSVDEEIPIFTFPLASFEGVRVHPWVWLGPGTWLKMWP